MVAALSWASGSYLATRIAMPRDPFVSTAAQMLAASAVLVVAGLAIGERPDLAVAQAHPDSVLALAYLIVFGSLLAFTAYAWVLQHWPISRVATYAYVNPLVAVVLGGLILGEPLTVPILLGGAAIVVAVAVVIRQESQHTREPATPLSRLALPSALDMDLPALLVLAAILAVKETGVPIPVPGDLLVIGAGVASTRGGLPVPAVVVVLVAATVVGGIVQFTLIRGRARAAVLGLLARVGLGAAVVERGAGRLRTGGAPAVAVARMTPGVRIVAIASSAVAGVASTSFLAGLIVGNGVFLTGHFILGLVVGEPAVQLVAGAGTGLVIAGVALAAVGAAGWWLLARRRARAQAPAPTGWAAWPRSTGPMPAARPAWRWPWPTAARGSAEPPPAPPRPTPARRSPPAVASPASSRIRRPRATHRGRPIARRSANPDRTTRAASARVAASPSRSARRARCCSPSRIAGAKGSSTTPAMISSSASPTQSRRPASNHASRIASPAAIHS